VNPWLKSQNARGPAFKPSPLVFVVFFFGLAGDNVRRTRAFFALSYLELNLLAFLKMSVAFRLDFRVMNEQIIAAIIWHDKSKAFVPVKPFYCTCTHYCAPLAF
jgi:hypothetical protein